MSIPRINLISGEFYRRAKCVVCGKTAERVRTFTGSSMEEINQKGKAWGNRPLAHKKCEMHYLGEEPL